MLLPSIQWQNPRLQALQQLSQQLFSLTMHFTVEESLNEWELSTRLKIRVKMIDEIASNLQQHHQHEDDGGADSSNLSAAIEQPTPPPTSRLLQLCDFTVSPTARPIPQERRRRKKTRKEGEVA